MEAQRPSACNGLPPAASVYNPIDALGTAQPEDYALCIEAALKDENVDTVLVLLTPQAMTKPTETAQVLVEAHEKYPNKPILAVFMGGQTMVYPRVVLNAGRIPVFDFPERAVNAIAELYNYTMRRDSLRDETVPKFKVDTDKTISDLKKREMEAFLYNKIYGNYSSNNANYIANY